MGCSCSDLKINHAFHPPARRTIRHSRANFCNQSEAQLRDFPLRLTDGFPAVFEFSEATFWKIPVKRVIAKFKPVPIAAARPRIAASPTKRLVSSAERRELLLRAQLDEPHQDSRWNAPTGRKKFKTKCRWKFTGAEPGAIMAVHRADVECIASARIALEWFARPAAGKHSTGFVQ